MDMFWIKLILEYTFWMAISTVMPAKSHAPFIDTGIENTELIQQRAGYDVKLQCNLKGLVDESKITDVKIHWYFQQCGENLPNMMNCHNFHEEEWTQLPCEQPFCKSELLLHNVTEKYSGLYKCTVYPYRSETGQVLDIQLVRTYQLDVKNSSMAVPEFLDYYPLNQTVMVGTQVLFQCRVHSEVQPTIKWFRRKPEPSEGLEYASGMESFNAHIVHYNGHTYELLSKAREKFISDDIYLSKLMLNGVRLQDEGYYACVAISYRGHRIREAYLQVYPSEEAEYWSDYDDSDEVGGMDPKEFWLLFLMPLGLAMLPLSVWLGYIVHKRCKELGTATTTGERTEQYSDEEMAPDRRMLKTWNRSSSWTTWNINGQRSSQQMSRKRTSRRSCSQTALVDATMPCLDAAAYEYEYYRPGCYSTPQVVRQATPYSCSNCFHECHVQWGNCSEGMYVVDSYGMVYYLSDFESLLQLPNNLTLDTDITHHYHFDNDESENMDDEEEAAVSPRKRERFECDADALEEHGEQEPKERTEAVGELKVPEPGNVYRSEEGYLVEEPSDEPDVATPK